MPSSRAKLWVTIAAPFLALLLLELGLRAFGFEHDTNAMPVFVWNGEHPDGAGLGGTVHQLDPWSLWSPRPGAPVGRQSSEVINSRGFRGPELPPERAPGTQCVVLLGESSIFGVSVPWEKTCAPRLSSMLAARDAPACVIDAGVMGYTLLQGLEHYRSAVRPLHPDVVCAAFGVANESNICQGLSDADKLALARDNRDRAPSAWDRLSRHVRVLQLIDWLRVRRETSAVHDLLDQRIAERSGALDIIGRVDWPGCRRVPLADFEAALTQLSVEVEADGARLILINLPRMPELEARRPIQSLYSDSIEKAGARLALPVVDLRALVRKAAASGIDPATFFLPDDVVHLGPNGQAALAALLADAIAPPR